MYRYYLKVRTSHRTNIHFEKKKSPWGLLSSTSTDVAKPVGHTDLPCMN